MQVDPLDTSPTWPGDYPSADDFAVLNQGQLKFLATEAAAELNANLPGGAGADLLDVVLAWEAPPTDDVTRDDYAATNQGQLKTVAQLFYARLIEEGFTTALPWTTPTGDDSNYSAANLGQAKYLFSFDLMIDIDADGMPDWWEQLIVDADPNDDITSIADVDPDGHLDGDSQDNLTEWQKHTNPLEADSDGDGAYDSTEATAGTNPAVKDHPEVNLVVEVVVR